MCRGHGERPLSRTGVGDAEAAVAVMACWEGRWEEAPSAVLMAAVVKEAASAVRAARAVRAAARLRVLRGEEDGHALKEEVEVKCRAQQRLRNRRLLAAARRARGIESEALLQ